MKCVVREQLALLRAIIWMCSCPNKPW